MQRLTRLRLAALGLLFLCACQPSTEQSESAVFPISSEAPAAPLARAEPPPPSERSRRFEGVFELGSELEPEKLGDLAKIVNVCGGPWSRKFLNEPKALEIGRATRDGDILRLSSTEFVNPYAVLDGTYGPRDPDVWEYHYLGTYGAAGPDVVHVQYSEGNGFLLLGAGSQAATEFSDLPVPSPSGRYFATAVDTGMGFSGVEVGALDQTGPGSFIQFESHRGPCGLTWVSDTEATFMEATSRLPKNANPAWSEETQQYFGQASIRLVEGEWMYTPAD